LYKKRHYLKIISGLSGDQFISSAQISPRLQAMNSQDISNPPAMYNFCWCGICLSLLLNYLYAFFRNWKYNNMVKKLTKFGKKNSF